ncbi:SWIM-type domain-containing protein [Pycnococcus provasolii]
MEAASPFMPRTIAEVKEHTFEEGMVYASRAKAEADIKQSRKEMLSSHNYKARDLMPVLKAAVTNNPNLQPKHAVAHIAPYVSKTVTAKFAGKVLSEAKTAQFSPGDNMSKVLPYADLVNKSGVGFMEVNTTDAKGMKKIYVERAKADHVYKYSKADEIPPFTEPDTSSITDAGGPYFVGFTYVPQAMVKIMEAGMLESTPSFSDGCFCDGAVKGTLLSTSTVDANRGILNLATTFTIKNESKESWTEHFKHVSHFYGPHMNTPEHSNVADADKGLVPSRKDVFPSMHKFMCKNHRVPNCQHQAGVGAAGAKLYEEAVYGYSAIKFRHAMENMNEATKTYLSKAPAEEQFLRPAYLGGHHLRGWATQNPAESWNNKLRVVGIRTADPLNMMVKLVSTIEKDIEEHGRDAYKCTDVAPPRIRKFLLSGGETGKDVSDFLVSWQGESQRVAHVMHKNYPNAYLIVNLNEASCTCCRPEVVEGPFCVHLAAAAKAAGIDLSHHLKDFDTTVRWRQQYDKANDGRKTAPGTADLELVAKRALQAPTAAPRRAGRPAKPTRQLSSLEMATKKMTCRVCKQKGHRAGSKKCPGFVLADSVETGAAAQNHIDA